MGDLVPFNGAANMALALAGQNKDPETLYQEQQKRIEEAKVLEEKLKVIQESVPTRIYNTCSSSAGAGSSDFHMYRMIRKAEQERWKRIEKTHAAETEKAEFEAKRKAREQEAEEKTAKNRAKRQKKKAKAKTKESTPGGDADHQEGQDSEEPEKEQQDNLPQADLD